MVVIFNGNKFISCLRRFFVILGGVVLRFVIFKVVFNVVIFSDIGRFRKVYFRYEVGSVCS